MALGGHSWKTAGRIWFKPITDGELNDRCSFKRFAGKDNRG